MAFSNCSFADQSESLRSPNFTPGRVVSGMSYGIDTITLHMVVGHLSLQALANVFKPTSRQASSNYGIDDQGNIGMFVEEKNRSWCSSNRNNDVRAITVEIASDTYAPYAMTQGALDGAVKLCIDVCRRNGIKKMIWIPDKEWALARQKKLVAGEGIFTVHRWFDNTSCPGEFLYTYMTTICDRVNAALGAVNVGDDLKIPVTSINADSVVGSRLIDKVPEPAPTPTPTPTPAKIVVGSKVTINPGARAGGMSSDPKTGRGVLIDSKYANGKYVDTVTQIATHYGVEEALLKVLFTWVATSSLTLVQ